MTTSVKHYVDLAEYSLYLSDLCISLEKELLKVKTVITSGLMKEENAQSFKEYSELIQKEIQRQNKEYNRACYLDYHLAKLIELTDDDSMSFYMWANERIKAKRTYQ